MGRPRTRARGPEVPAAIFARETIEHLLEQRAWSESEAAHAWGVPQATLNGIAGGRAALSLQTLSMICEAEGWTPLEFFLNHPRARQTLEADRYAQTSLAKAIQGLDPKLVNRIGRRVFRLMHLGLARETAELVDELTALLEKVAERARD